MGDPFDYRIHQLPDVDRKYNDSSYGWYHGDIGGNFIVNPETGDIAAFIDWETAGFCDWTNDIMAAYRFMSKRGFGDIMMRTVLEYGHLYATGQVKKGK